MDILKRKLLTLDVKMLKLQCSGNHPDVRLFHKLSVCRKKLSMWNTILINKTQMEWE